MAAESKGSPVVSDQDQEQEEKGEKSHEILSVRRGLLWMGTVGYIGPSVRQPSRRFPAAKVSS